MVSKNATRPARDPALRRREVAAAARKLFFESGYRGTTIQQVADSAGYSKRSVYLDFSNKDDLFSRICIEGGELLLEQLQGVDTDALDAEACLERFVKVYVDFSQEHREYFRMIFSETSPQIVANSSPETRAAMANIEREALQVLVDWHQRAVAEGKGLPTDPWEAAAIVTGTATGIILLSTGGSQTIFSQANLESLARTAIRIFWAGARSLSEETRNGD